MKLLIFISLFFAMSVLGMAQAIPGVTVNSIALSGNIVTVTTAMNHGLAVSQGVCLGGPSNVCAVASSVPTGTTFTFTNPLNNLASACASSCGTAQAAKQITILNSGQPTANTWTFTALFWLTTPTPYKTGTGAITAYSGATTAEQDAISLGNFIEVQRAYGPFSISYSIANIKADLQADYAAAQSNLQQSIQPGQYLGVYFNGAWSQ